MQSTATHARFLAAEGLRILDFGDDAVVFQPLSWDAHLLNPAARAVLDLLLESPKTESQVADFLREALRPDEQSRARFHAAHLIAELQALGLARRVAEGPSAAR